MSQTREKYQEYAPNYEPPILPAAASKKQVRSRSRSKARAKPVKSATKTRKRARSASPLPEGARYVSPVKKGRIDKKAAKAAANDFKDYIEALPIYVISAHACMCPKASCFGEKYSETFTIPKDTFIVNMTYPGDTFCMIAPEQYLRDNYREVILYMLAHSTSDTNPVKDKGNHSFFGDIRRAGPGTALLPVKYLNISYTLNEKVKDADGNETLLSRDKNPYGVYRIQDLVSKPENKWNNTMSVLPQNEKRFNWFLHDIIKEVYKAEKISKAIFISTGCLSECGAGPAGLPDETIAEYQRIFDLASVRYNTLFPTLTKDEIIEYLGREYVANDPGITSPTSGAEARNLMRLVKAGLIDPDVTMAEYPDLFAQTEDIEKFKKKVRKWEKNEEEAVKSIAARLTRRTAKGKK